MPCLKSVNWISTALLLSLTSPFLLPETLAIAGSFDVEIIIPGDSVEQLQKRLERLHHTLEAYRKSGDYESEANTLNQMGEVYTDLKKFQTAIKLHQQAIAIYQQIGDRKGEVETLGYIGNSLFKSGRYQQVEALLRRQLENFKQADEPESEQALLEMMRRYLKNRWGLTAACNGAQDQDIQQRFMYGKISWQEILDISQLNLFISELVGTPQFDKCFGHQAILHGIGWAYRNLGEYSKALDFYQQSLAFSRQSTDKFREAFVMIDIGLLYNDLAQHEKALETIQQSLYVGEEICKCMALSKMGLVYKELKQYDKALRVLQEALKLPDPSEEHNILNYTGSVYFELGQHLKAIEYYQKALKKPPIAGEYGEKGFILNNIGTAYSRLGEHDKAFTAYQEALALFRELNEHPGQRVTLNNIGLLFEKKNRPELAIVFYKQAVNVTENIRLGLREMTRKEQEAYTQTVADTYRRLANLLLSQGRLLEAQQVLELLKIQELRDFTRNARAGGDSNGIALANIETDILKKYDSLITFGQTVYDCEQKKCVQLSQLRDQLDALTDKFNQESNAFRKTLRDRLATDPGLLEPEALRDTASKIVSAESGTVLIYPLVLEDKVRILLATRAGEKGVVFRTVETKVKQRQLWDIVMKYREQLKTPLSKVSDVKATSQQLYDWLIKPLEPELSNPNVRRLVFSLDRSTRYIPMAALFDAKTQKHLIERYAISTILSAKFTDVLDRLPANKQETRVLAMGVSKAFPGFSALENVPIELASIVEQQGRDQQGVYPGLEFLNEAFNFRALRDNLAGNKVLHIATHGKFESGRPEDSFLLLGTGDRFSVEQIQKLQNYMADIHLVVLSACETALGGPDHNGIEMSGISYYFLSNGAKAVMASLWLVNDGSTSLLMQQFYKNLAAGTMTKAEALQQAQLSLLQGKVTAKDTPQRSDAYVTLDPALGAQLPRSRTPDFSHPYYWAPFILIGNSL
ncbi:CHAT domain-containing protein [Trichocoleus sp. DQ-A3]|uniref:CHAT domain-containing protein n=1 Tax=Cyanophyceae TaxID=3028117 RepID=UPI001688DDDB|nr:CHAT domain-containing protein [Coleofasciculus sp. FACHB-125]MBD1903800.1 CHAT domain-containing protein [Coleofasciculus sp. FACHB-125]